jgi:sugar transferase (PEP-CTERM system associated)
MVRVFNRYTAPRSLLLVVLEAALVALSLVLAAKLRFWQNPGGFEEYTQSYNFVLQACTVSVIVLMCFYYNDLYDLRGMRTRNGQVASIGQALGAGCILLSAIYFFIPGLLVGKGVLLIAVCTIFPSVSLMRVGLNRVWKLTTAEKRVVILGEGDLARLVADELSRRDDLDLKFVGFITSVETAAADIFGCPNLGSTAGLRKIVSENGVSKIIVALEDRRGALPSRDLMRLRIQGIDVQDAPSALAALTGRIWLGSVRPSWFLFSGGFRRSAFTVFVKRAVDLAVGVLGLVLTSPVMLLVAIAIRLDSKGPIFYSQTRVGLGDQPFEILKFRSMFTEAEAQSGAQWSQLDDPRITRAGRILRKYRLDELPQFVNVMRGEMSIVGPRPERPVFVEILRERIPFYDERHSVRPGVTGWAQVEYKYGSTVDDAHRKLEYDLFYLKNMSVLFDIAILIRTVRIVLFGHEKTFLP